MPGNYTLRETYVDGDVLSAADYVADHQQHIDNQTPQGTDDYSANVTQMRTTTTAGDVGSESLPTSLAGEIERLRFAIKQIKDTMNGSAVAQWYTTSFSLFLSDGSIAATKLADGATYIQAVNSVGLLANWNNLMTTVLTQAFTNTRTRLRLSAYVAGDIEFATAGVGAGVIQWRIKRDGVIVYTSPAVHPSMPAAGFVDFTIPYADSAVIILTGITAGAHSWTIEGAKGNNNISFAATPHLTIEEIA